MRKLNLLLILLLFSYSIFSQDEIKIGAGKYIPGNNIDSYIQGKTTLSEKSYFNQCNYVIIQFETIPTKQELIHLNNQGIDLFTYIGNKCYYAAIQSNNLTKQISDTKIVSIQEIQPEWKLNQSIIDKKIPKYAKSANNTAKFHLVYFENVSKNQVTSFLDSYDIKIIRIAPEFNTVDIEFNLDLIEKLSSQPWVNWIEFLTPPYEQENIQGRSMNRINILSDNSIDGLKLTGKGINVGIWDGNVQSHPDLGNRVITKEYETHSAHGQHTSGTLAGAGIISPRGTGMAPEAKLYTWNYTNGTNGMNTQQEMLYSIENYDITLTSNSYGVPMTNYCSSPMRYNSADAQIDQLVNMHPSLMHVYSAGNDQKKCADHSYSSSTKRMKNAILVGALDELSEMTNFSSWGPMNDGRILPHICSFGNYVYSTVYNNAYDDSYWSGTSMACPAVSGTIALLYQYYNELNGKDPLASLIKGAVLNTAEDKGNPNLDFQFGYGVLNGERASEILKNEYYIIDTIEHGKNNIHTIQVPTNTTELRVMIVWSDYKGNILAPKALVNDLDLSVSDGNTLYSPWVLDHKNPSESAIRGTDRLNNQEQVTITNPAEGTYTITVNGFEIPEQTQEYSLVYYFSTPELKISYPNGGEKFKPGDHPVVRWNSNGHSGNYTLQFSTDGGDNFKTIATDIPSTQNDYILPIPEIISNKAIVRVIQNGTMDRSDVEFSIMNEATNLELSPAECGASGWSLSWNAVENAVKYKVLKADVAAGKYIELGETALTNYDLPELNNERNIYSVIAISEDNVESERAYAVIANPSVPLNLSTVGIPFEENLESFPSDYLRVSSGKGVNTFYSPTLFTYDKAHVVVMQGNNATANWNEIGDFFENNPDDVASARFCEIDATNITGQLWFRIAGVMANSGDNNARLRLLANNNVVENNYGHTEMPFIESGQNVMYWDLSDKAGSKFSIELQAVLRNQKDSLQIGHFKLFQPTYDVSVSKLEISAPAPSLSSSESITIKVRNRSGEQISNIPVSYSVNGENLINETIEGPLQAFKSITYTFNAKANFSYQDSAYTVKATVSLPNDTDESNNSMTQRTASVGDYFLIPEGMYGNNKTVNATPINFTDDGGRILNYSNDFNGSVVFKPASSGKKARIKFLEFDLDAPDDKIIIYDGSYSSSPVIAELSGNEMDLPAEFISSSYYGDLRVEFISNAETNSLGWFAEVWESDAVALPTDNIFTLSGISKYNGYYPGETDIRINIKNNDDASVSDVRVQYKVNDGDWSDEEVIPSVAAGSEISYTFSQKTNLLPWGQTHSISARILNEDDNMEDNVSSRKIINDKYCIGYTNYSSYTSGGLFHIVNVEKDEVFNETSSAISGSPYPQYFRDIEFPVYADLPNNKITVTVNKDNTSGRIQIWIDWNNDGNYSNDGGPYQTSVVGGETSYDIPVSIPSGTSTGKKYMRVKVTTAASQDPCASEYSNNGEVEDYTIELIENFPIRNDLSVVSTSIVNSEFGANEIINATIANNAAVSVSNFNIAYSIDDMPMVTETISSEILPFENLVYDFTTPADLSESGMHTIKIFTLLEDDQDLENDTLQKVVVNTLASGDGFYAINFDGVDDIIDAGTLNNVNLQSFTYETWTNPSGYGAYGQSGFGRLFEGKAATIFFHGENNNNYPNHCLVISSIGGGTYYTDLNSIELNKWQHIAVSFNNDTKELKVHLNGQEIHVNVKSIAGTIADNSTNSLYIGNRPNLDRQYQGIIDEARIWNIARSQEEINSGMFVHQTGEDGLIAEFSFDEGYYFNETKSGEIKATILNAKLEPGENSIWTEPTKLFTEISFNDQVSELLEVSENTYSCDVLSDTDLSTILPEFTITYPNVKAYYENNIIESGNTVIDFSTSETNPVKIEFRANLFGKDLVETMHYIVKNEANSECELISFSMLSANNASLTKDIIANPVSQSMTFAPNPEADISALVVNFELSEGAKAIYNNTELISGSSSLDFNNPVIITIVAANGRTKNYYGVNFLKTQIISWNPENTTFIYGDNEVLLDGLASSGLEVVYHSDNENIIKPVDNKLIITGTGTVNITASQEGSSTTVPAIPVIKQFTINKATLIAKANDVHVGYSQPIPEFTISYNGFVNNEDPSVIDMKPTASTLATQNSEPGEYVILISGGNDDNYSISPENGILTITKDTEFLTEFSVVNGNGSLNAYMGEEELSSGSNVNSGSEITFNAEPNDGYQVKEWTLNGNIITDNNTNTLTVSDIHKETTVTVEFEETPIQTYMVDFGVSNGNGILKAYMGEEELSSGSNVNAGSEITFNAEPNDAYQVKEWTVNGNIVTDINTNTLTISDIKEETTVTVEFEEIPPVTYPVNFSVINGNGSIAALVNNSEINSGNQVIEASAVVFTANPADAYRVKEWTVNGTIITDNNTNTLTISDIKEETTVTVEFEEIPVQTYMVDFSVLNGNGILKAYMGEEELSSGSIVNAGSEIICKAEPNVGYQVKEWTVNGNIVSDNNTETYTSSEVNEDITLSVEFENTTSVDNNFSETRIYPNPFDNWITIEHKTSVNRIDIINISGQKLIHMNVNGALKTKINTQALKSGIYILKLHYTNGEAQIHKLIK